MDLNEGISNQTRRVASINTSTNVPVNISNTRHAATFNYPSCPYDEDEVADADLNFKKEKKKKTKALMAVIMFNAKVIHIYIFRNLYVIIIIMRCWNRKAPQGPALQTNTE